MSHEDLFLPKLKKPLPLVLLYIKTKKEKPIKA